MSLQVTPLWFEATPAVNAVTGTVNPSLTKFREGVFQIVVNGGSGTVAIQGRLAETAPWETIQSFTATGMVTVALMPFMRATVTATTALDVSAWLQA